MTTASVLLLALLPATLAAHAAAASSPAPLLDATVHGLLLDGAARLDGALGSIGSTGDAGQDPASPVPTQPREDMRVAPAGLHLSARHLRIETDLQTQTGPSAAGKPQHDTQESQETNAIAEASPARHGFLFFVGPQPGRPAPVAHLEGAKAHLLPVPASAAEPPRRVSSARPPLAAGAGPAIDVAGAPGTLRLEGDFVLTMWEWDLNVTTTSGTHTYPSGYAYHARAPSVGSVDTFGDSAERQLFVYADGAVLDLVLPDGASAALDIQPTSLGLDGRLTLAGPTGTLATAQGPRTLRDGDWVTGVLTAALGDLSRDSFHLGASGTVRDTSLGGAVVPAVLPEAGIALETAVAGAATLLLVAAAGWAWWRRRTRPQGTLPAGPSAAAPSTQPADVGDERRLLEWLAAQPADRLGLLWDSDIMAAFAWTEDRAQRTLRSLQRLGQVRAREVEIAPGRWSVGTITLTRAGRARLAPATAPTPPKTLGFLWVAGLRLLLVR